MDFTLGEDRQALVDVLGRLLRERYSIDLRTKATRETASHDAATWRQLADVGAIGALFAPEQGGFGGSPFDVIAVFETLGQSLVAEPVLPVLMAGTVLARGAPELLPAIVAGDRIVSVAFHEPHSRYDVSDVLTCATASESGWRLDGAKAVVQHAEAADALIVSARDGEGCVSVFLVPVNAPGVTVRGYETIDGMRAAEVVLAGVELGEDAHVGNADDVARAIAIGTLALCAEALGAMEWLKDTTLDYLRTRVQFGTPIGENQALQHRMANVLIELEQARSSVINAAAAIDGRGAVRDRALAAAKYTIGVSGTHVAEEAIQMHGGIGMTRELNVSHYAKRTIMIDHQLGDSDHHLATYIELAAA